MRAKTIQRISLLPSVSYTNLLFASPSASLDGAQQPSKYVCNYAMSRFSIGAQPSPLAVRASRSGAMAPRGTSSAQSPSAEKCAHDRFVDEMIELLTQRACQRSTLKRRESQIFIRDNVEYTYDRSSAWACGNPYLV